MLEIFLKALLKQIQAPPSSTCTNGANQVLKCDDKIYVKVEWIIRPIIIYK